MFKNRTSAFVGIGTALVLAFFLARNVLSTPNALVVTWDIPTTYEDGTAMPKAQITGFDIYVSKDDKAPSYAAWFKYNADTDAKYTYTIDGVGKYCFTLITVSKDNGKSQSSDEACYIVIDTGPVTGFKPKPPTNVDIAPLE